MGAQKIRAFFPSPATMFFLSLSFSGGLLVEFWWCLNRRSPEMCTFGVLGLWCASPGDRWNLACLVFLLRAVQDPSSVNSFFFEREREMMMKFAERVEGKQGERTAPGVKPHPDHVSRWWSPTTSEVVGVSPSAEAQHLRSNSDKANARAAVHAMRTLHLRNHATIADFRTTSGSHLALASARALRKLLASVDHLPNRAPPIWPAPCPQRALGISSLCAFVPAATQLRWSRHIVSWLFRRGGSERPSWCRWPIALP